jgi:hypothetical protein
VVPPRRYHPCERPHDQVCSNCGVGPQTRRRTRAGWCQSSRALSVGGGCRLSQRARRRARGRRDVFAEHQVGDRYLPQPAAVARQEQAFGILIRLGSAGVPRCRRRCGSPGWAHAPLAAREAPETQTGNASPGRSPPVASASAAGRLAPTLSASGTGAPAARFPGQSVPAPAQRRKTYERVPHAQSHVVAESWRTSVMVRCGRDIGLVASAWASLLQAAARVSLPRARARTRTAAIAECLPPLGRGATLSAHRMPAPVHFTLGYSRTLTACWIATTAFASAAE